MEIIKLLSLDESIAILDRFIATRSEIDAAKTMIPPMVIQYWDQNPPGEVRELLERNTKLCRSKHVAYCLFDDLSAKEFIADNFSSDVSYAYDLSPHPAMKSDLFRLCFLLLKGGFYLDADMAFRECFYNIFSIKGEVSIFKWASHGRNNVCNWLVGAAPQSEVIRFVLDATVQSITKACELDRKQALKNILGVSGPGLLTRAVATYIARNEGDAGALPIAVNTVEYAYLQVQNGPEFLKRRLEYKNTELHWLVAAKNAE
jgi:mannosyltransferase OCH1-like enzyme